LLPLAFAALPPALPAAAPPFAWTFAVQPATTRRCWIRSTTACRLAIRASDRASGLAFWPAMKVRLLPSAVSRPAQLSPALLIPVLTAKAPPISAAAAAPMISFRVRLLLLVRYMHRSFSIDSRAVAAPVGTGRSIPGVHDRNLNNS
jgi:hypothetical protein